MFLKGRVAGCVGQIVYFCLCVGSSLCVLSAHPGFESDEFEDHFHSEDGGEGHVEDVHDVVELR